MGRELLNELRAQLKAAKDEQKRLKEKIVEAAQHNTELERIIARQKVEKDQIQKDLDFKTFQLNGFQHELELRHYELPFLAAQLEALFHVAKWPEPTMHVLESMKSTIDDLMKYTGGQKPSLDPVSWVVLARKLGFALSLQTRRTPVKGDLPSAVESTG